MRRRPAIRLLAAALLALTACGARAQPVSVKADSGELVGSSDGAVASFKGVPYAAPPVGELRWATRLPASIFAWSAPWAVAEVTHKAAAAAIQLSMTRLPHVCGKLDRGWSHPP